MLEPLFQKYVARYPDVYLDIVIAKDHLAEKVLNGDLDVAECVYRPSSLVKGVLFQKVQTLEYTCVMTSTHPLANRSRITYEDLMPYPLGIVDRANFELVQHLHTNFPDAKITNLTGSELTNIYNICYNQGIYISKAPFSRLLSPLVAIPLDSHIQFQCGVIYRENSSPPVKDFLRLIREIYPEE